MTTIIRAYRERPITRPGQVERVLIKFGIGPQRAHLAWADGDPEAIAWTKIEAEAEQKAVQTGFILTAEQMKAIDQASGWSHDTTEWPEEYELDGQLTFAIERRRRNRT